MTYSFIVYNLITLIDFIGKIGYRLWISELTGGNILWILYFSLECAIGNERTQVLMRVVGTGVNLEFEHFVLRASASLAAQTAEHVFLNPQVARIPDVQLAHQVVRHLRRVFEFFEISFQVDKRIYYVFMFFH